MSEIKRYMPSINRAGLYDSAEMRQMAGGLYVKRPDHLAALQQARIDAVREFAECLVRDCAETTHNCMMEISDTEIPTVKELEESEFAIGFGYVKNFARNYIEQLKGQSND